MRTKESPPRYLLSFLRWFCPPSLLEGIEGDVVEEFETNRLCYGEGKATRMLVLNVLKFFRPGILFRNKITHPAMNLILIVNYFKISWRYLSKNKTFAAINILGLATGMAVALLLYEYTTFEQGFDSFHTHADQIYRVTTHWNKDVTPNDKRATTMPWSGPGVKEAFPEVLDYARFADVEHFTGYNTVSYNGKKINEQDIFLADPGFLRMFSFKLLHGNTEHALNDPASVVITNSIATKYFENENPIGKVLFIDTHGNLSENNFVVTGVIEDPPINTHLTFDFLLSYNVIWNGLSSGSTYWHWDFTYSYLLLKPNVNVSDLEKKMTHHRIAQFGKEMQYYNDAVEFRLQPIRDIHLFSSLKGEVMINSDGRFVYFLMLVGISTLVSAYINYINLSTVKAVERKTEIGVRKVVGSTRKQLTIQLLVESAVLNILAVVISFVLYALCVPLIEHLFNIQWPSQTVTSFSGEFIFFVVAIVSSGIVMSALYPAFVLAAFKPVAALKGSGGTGETGRGWTHRKSLIVVQFVFCIGFTVGAFALYQQIQYMKNHDLGMSAERVISIKGYGFDDYLQDEILKAKLSALPFIQSVGLSSAAPGDEIIELSLKPKIAVAEKPSQTIEVKLIMVDEKYFETLGIKMAAGRNFNRSVKTDDEAVIINEAAARLLGYDDPQNIVDGSLKNLQEKDSKVIGVIKNYHQRSLRNEHEPIVFKPLWRNDFGWNKQYMFVRFNPVSETQVYQELLAEVEKEWTAVKPDKPFQYFFLDNYFDHQYKTDTTFSGLFLFFTVLAIVIACLGLFGLVAYTTLQRTKEIGIRKVMGASVESILSLLSWDFLKLILVATSIAVPVVGWGVQQWLAQYAFRIPLTIGLFLIPLTIIFILALLTVILKSLKVATVNPVKSLKWE